MNSPSLQPCFQVTAHYELTDRGAFVVGRIVSGTWRIGTSVVAADGTTRFRIAGIEYLDNVSERTSAIALVFRESPTMSQVTRAFPVGTVLLANEGA